MKHSRKEASLPRTLFALLLLGPVLAACGGSPKATSGPADDKAGTAGAGTFEVVSSERVDSLESNSAGGQRASWPAGGEEGGLLLVLKLKGSDSTVYYSSDFSLGYDDPQGIPRSACMGLSLGVASPDGIKTGTWMLGGSMSRGWADAKQPYVGLLFSVPRKVKQVSLYRAAPFVRTIDLPPAGEKK